jgi:ATP-binding cassette subfamily F protein uup
VPALKAMRRERAQRREQVGNVKLARPSAAPPGKRVIEAKDLSFA